jgi:hypothetical protein
MKRVWALSLVAVPCLAVVAVTAMEKDGKMWASWVQVGEMHKMSRRFLREVMRGARRPFFFFDSSVRDGGRRRQTSRLFPDTH